MCELIRAAYAEGKLGTDTNLKSINKNFLHKIDCPGTGDVT
jgi:hypothetical protein